MRNPEKFLTFDEVRSLFGGLHRATIWRLIKDGKFPRPITFGRKLFWRPSDIAKHQAALARRAADAGRKAASRRSDEAAYPCGRLDDDRALGSPTVDSVGVEPPVLADFEGGNRMLSEQPIDRRPMDAQKHRNFADVHYFHHLRRFSGKHAKKHIAS